MSAQMLIGGAAAAVAAAAVYHQEKDHHTVSNIANGTTSHLKWNAGNIRDGLHDDLASFKDAVVHCLTFRSGQSRDYRNQSSMFGNGSAGSAKSGSWFGGATDSRDGLLERGRDAGREAGREASSWFRGDRSEEAGRSWFGRDARDTRDTRDTRSDRSWFGRDAPEARTDGTWLNGERDRSWFGREKHATLDDSDRVFRSGGRVGVDTHPLGTDARAKVDDFKQAGADLGRSAHAKVDDIKQAGADLGRSAQDRLQRSVNDAKQTLSGAASTVSGAASSAADASRDAASSAADKTQSLFNWGHNKAEKSKAIAIGEYDKANKDYQQALDAYNRSKRLLADGDQHLRAALESAQGQLRDCRDKLDAISAEFDHYARENISDISRRLEHDDRDSRGSGLFGWFRSQAPAADIDPREAHRAAASAKAGVAGAAADVRDGAARLASKLGSAEANAQLDSLHRPSEDEVLAANAARALRGWGETAASLANEELEEERSRAGRFWRK
ncbi:AaceriAER428Wp [[Ashbya] aceris (nom. inval.)]|nr:AaceriAER428Wp [[Ashbya] aceris (nom. inval.)]